MPLPSSRLRRLAVTTCALALVGCASVGPNFTAPEGPKGVAAQAYAMPGDVAPPAGVELSPEARAAGPWWQVFGSPELDRVIRQALADSPSLDEARATLQRAQAQTAAVRGAALPRVDLNGSAQRERINVQSFGFTGFPNPTISLYSIGGAVAYDLDLFGGRRRATEAAVARSEAAAHEADAAYLTISGNVALQAVRVATLRAQLEAVRRVVADDQRVLDMIHVAQQVGSEAPAATAGGEAQLAEDEALLPPLQRDLDVARHQLALLVGKSPAEWSAPDFELAGLAAPAAIPVSLPSQLVRTRPDIRAAEARLHAATADIGVAVANQYPSLRLTADLAQGAIEPDRLFNYSATGWSLVSGVSAPIFHGGALKAQRRGAEAEARAALARYQQTVIRAFVQVADVLSALGADQQEMESLARAERASAAHARDAQIAYQLGGGSLLQVIDAQRQLSRARRASVQAEGQRLADLVQLYAVTGADWRPEQVAR